MTAHIVCLSFVFKNRSLVIGVFGNGGVVYSKKSDICIVARILVTHFSGKVKSIKNFDVAHCTMQSFE